MKTPRYRHVRFYTLKIGEMFFLGVRAFWKVDYFRGRSILGSPVVVMPWTRIRSARPFGKVPTVISPGENNAALGYKASVNNPNAVLGYRAQPATPGVDNMSFRPPVEVTPGGDNNTALGDKATVVTERAIPLRFYGPERPPVEVTPGGDRTSETLGGNEKCPSA